MKKYFIFAVFLLGFCVVQVNAELDEDSLYDFYVNEISLYPSAPTINQDCKILVRVKNNGTNNFRTSDGINSKVENFEDFVIENGIYPTVSSSEPVAPGEYIEYIYTGYFKASGTKAIEFTIDNSDQVDETSETNNLLSVSPTVYGPEDADLSINKIEINILKPIVYEDVEIRVEIKNSGKNSFIDNKGFMFYNTATVPSIKKDIAYGFDNFELASVTMDEYPTIDNALNVNGIFVVTLQGRFVNVGEKDLEYSLNVNSRLIESDYENNIATSALMVYSSVADRDIFRISDITYEPISSSSAKFFWKTDTDMTTTLHYRSSISSNFEELVSANKTNHELTIEGLRPGALYYYKISALINDSTEETELRSFTLPAEVIKNEDPPTGSEQVEEVDEIAEEEPVSELELESDSQDNEIEINSETIKINNDSLYNNLKGKIILRVENNGEAYYVSPIKKEMYYLGRPNDAFAVMRERGIGISNSNLEKISISLELETKGTDQDGDGLADSLEDALGTDKTRQDSDNDTYSDKDEIEDDFDPGSGGGKKYSIDNNFALVNSGKIFLAVERNGEAWYVNPTSKKRYFLGRPTDAFEIMRGLGLGVSEASFAGL